MSYNIYMYFNISAVSTSYACMYVIQIEVFQMHQYICFAEF